MQALKLELQVRTAEADLRASFTARGRSVRRSLAVKRATLKRPTLRRGTATPLRCKSWVFCRTKSEGEPRAVPAQNLSLSLCALCECLAVCLGATLSGSVVQAARGGQRHSEDSS